MSRRALLPVLAAMGCAAPVSNAFLLEDLAYIEALPDAAQQSIEIDPAASPAEIADLLLSAAEVNTTVQDLLGWVETLSALPPTLREDNRRVWGPYPGDDVSSDWRAEIVRVDQGRFSWAFALRTDGGAWGTFFTGESVAGFDPSQSAGWLRFDADILQAHGGELDGSGALEISFDYINEFSIEGLIDIDGTPARYAYDRDDEAGEAWFGYSAPLNIDETSPALETYTVTGRWRLTGGGRSDTIADGGDLGSAASYRTLCWDATGALTYERQAIDGYGLYEEGSAQTCVYTEPASAP